MPKPHPDLAHLARPGAELRVRVTPRAARAGVELREDGGIAVRVTAPPADGRANRDATRLLASALGIAKSRLQLLRGATARDKLFRVGPTV